VQNFLEFGVGLELSGRDRVVSVLFVDRETTFVPVACQNFAGAKRSGMSRLELGGEFASRMITAIPIPVLQSNSDSASHRCHGFVERPAGDYATKDTGARVSDVGSGGLGPQTIWSAS
jgi:hypothetical protein